MSADLLLEMPEVELDEEANAQTQEQIRLGPEFEQFANFLDNSAPSQLSFNQQKQKLLELPQKYYENAKRRLDLLRRPLRRDTQDEVEMDTDEADPPELSPEEQIKISRVEKEVQTWDLFRRLLPLRYSETKFHPHRASGPTEGNILQQFLDADPKAQERRAVLQWLQSSASSSPDIDDLVQSLQQNAGRDEIIAHGWLHTRSAIKQRKSITGWPHLLDQQSPQVAQTFLNKDGAQMVTQLDPDAISRQGRKLEPQDEYFERAIWMGCFEHLRRGSGLDMIKEWCEDRTEVWRAVSMSVLALSLEDTSLATDATPEAICLWRRMCLSAARNAGSDDYEHAVYGLLSGEISIVERVSRTWDDFLFANYNGLLRSQLDNYLLELTDADTKTALNRSFPAFDAFQHVGHQDNIEQHLVSMLENRPDTKLEASEPNKALQGAFLANNLGEYLSGQGDLIRAGGTSATSSLTSTPAEGNPLSSSMTRYFQTHDHDGLRTAAHVYLLYLILYRPDPSALPRSTRDLDQKSSQMRIIAEYTKLLYRAGLKALVPLYCSALPEPACYEVMSESLIEETEVEQRMELLTLMKKAGLKGSEFARIQAKHLFSELGAENAISKISSDKFSILQDQGPLTARFGKTIKVDFIAKDDDTMAKKNERAIRGLEWLKDIDRTWPDIFSLGTRMYKYFYRNMHLLAAQSLRERVSFASVMEILIDPVADDTAFFDDVTYWQQLLEQSNIDEVSAEQVMMDARNFRELEALIAALDNLETVGSMAGMSEGLASANREFRAKIGAETKNARPLMQPLLQSWLDAGIQDGDLELKEIRQSYLPETILTYISALHFAGAGVSRDHLLEAMELASVLAAKENEGLINIFKAAGRMRELVDAFAACSKVLAFATAEKRSTGTGTKKLKELGWSRDIWSVQS